MLFSPFFCVIYFYEKIFGTQFIDGYVYFFETFFKKLSIVNLVYEVCKTFNGFKNN